jgi:hypothetical protein
MGYTNIYGWGYLEPYQDVGGVIDMDARRWQSMESQLLNLYEIFGNGVLDSDPLNPSWRIQTNPSDATGGTVLITPGKGHVNFIAAYTTTDSVVTLPTVGSYPITYWIYATENDTTSDLGTVDFVASSVEILQPDTYVGLGAVVISLPTGATAPVITPFNDAAHGRQVISLYDTLAAIINAHVHIGGASNPSPIDLGLHVQGKLSGDFITDLDLGTVTTGTLDPNRLPLIDHGTLTSIGTLTHPEIDSLLAAISSPQGYRLSDLMLANMLQLALALKEQAGQAHIDATLVNAILYIPGITPTSFEAWYSTGDAGSDDTVPDTTPLATIDHTNHQIVGNLSSPFNSDMLVWNTDTDFDNALSAALARTVSPDPPTHDVLVTGSGVDGGFTIDQPLNYRAISTTDLDTPAWVAAYGASDTSALATITPPAPPTLSAPSFHNEFIDGYGFSRYLYQQFSSAQDWSQCQNLGIGYGLSSQSVPGDVYAFLIVDGGTAVSVVQGGSAVALTVSTPALVRSRSDATSPTRVFHITHISEFGLSESQAAAVKGVGFLWKTATGWDSKEVDFYLIAPSTDEVVAQAQNAALVSYRQTLPDVTSSLFIWNDTLFAPTARLVFRFDSGSANTQYDVVTFDPSSSQVVVSTRTAASQAALENSLTFPLSGSNVDANSRTGQWLDIVVELAASSDLLSAPTVGKVTLTFDSTGLAATKVWDTEALWLQGRDFVNVSTPSDNYLHLADSSQVGAFRYVRSDTAYQDFALTSDGESIYQDGSRLYKTPSQVWEGGSQVGFQGPRDMTTLASGHVVVADTVNDRVVEVDADGNLVRAIQGNIGLSQIQRDFVALSAVFNPRLGTLWVAFSQLVTVSDKTQMALVSGQNALAFGTTGINVVPFAPINGKSATLMVTFTAAQAASISAWTGLLELSIGAGAVASAGFQPITSNPVVNPQSVGAPIIVPPPVGQLTSNPLPANVSGFFTNLYGGTAEWLAGLPAPPGTSSTTPIYGDFDGDGLITTTLQGPGGQKGVVALSVTVAEIVWDNVYSPLSVQVDSLGDWIVAMVGSDTAVDYDTTGVRLWSLPQSLVAMQDGKGGSACLMPSGNVLLASPAASGGTQGAVTVVNRSAGNVPIVSVSVDGDAVRALPNGDETEFWVAVDDDVTSGRVSRVIRVNGSGKVVWSSGYGVVYHPTGLEILPNGDVLVSE